jgi:hypothetical protein
VKKGDYVRCINIDNDLVKKGKIYRVEDIDHEGDPIVRGDAYMSADFEPVKVAVHCKTEEEWERVQKEAFGAIRCSTNYFNGREKDYCINPSSTWGGKSYYASDGYHIISAQEYLGEEEINQKGGSEVEEKIKVGDKVLITGIQDGEDFCGEELVVSISHDGGSVTVKKPNGGSWFYETCNFKPIKQNKGEDKMNKNIVAVFEKTEEAVMVEDYLTDAIKERIFMEKNKPAILKACKEAKEAAEAKD